MKKRFINAIISLIMCQTCLAQAGEILSTKKLSATSGGFSGLTTGLIGFGRGLAPIGDLDKDGIQDFAVSFYDNSTSSGNIFILLMTSDFQVKSFTRIGPNIGGLNGNFQYSFTYFGSRIINVGDLDGDGVNELATGNAFGATNSTGQIFIIFLNSSGAVKKYTIIDESIIPLNNNANFGMSICNLGDRNGDGQIEIGVGAPQYFLNGSIGAVFSLTLDKNGTVRDSKIINNQFGGFNGSYQSGYGYFLGDIGDIDNDGITDIMVSSNLDLSSEIWTLLIDSSFNVKSYQRIYQNVGGYTDSIKPYDSFGWTIANAGDIDGDNTNDVFVSSIRDSVNGIVTGRVRILFLNNDGSVREIKRIDNNATNFTSTLDDDDAFGTSIYGNIDLNGDFKKDVLIGSSRRDDGGLNKGAIYLLSLDGTVHPTPPKALWRVNATTGNQNTVFNFTQYSTGFPSNYKWSFTPNTVMYQNGTTDTSANPVVKFTQSAYYTVQLKVTNPFSSDSLLRSNYINIQTTGLFTPNASQVQVELYPNPTTGSITIQSPVSMQHVWVYDITGKLLLLQQPDGKQDEINLTELNAGIYFVQIQTSQGVQTHKISKQ